VGAFPWRLVLLASPFVTTFREMREMRFLWRTSVQMKNTRLIATLGREPHTRLNLAVEATLVGMGLVRLRHRPSIHAVFQAGGYCFPRVRSKRGLAEI